MVVCLSDCLRGANNQCSWSGKTLLSPGEEGHVAPSHGRRSRSRKPLLIPTEATGDMLIETGSSLPQILMGSRRWGAIQQYNNTIEAMKYEAPIGANKDIYRSNHNMVRGYQCEYSK